jgi:hypothetical protein
LIFLINGIIIMNEKSYKHNRGGWLAVIILIKTNILS